MSLRPRLRAILAGIALALSGVVACEAWHRGMWGTLTGAGLVAAWIVLFHAWRSGLESAPAEKGMLSVAQEPGSRRLLLDAAPTPMLAIEDGEARALNRAARRLFATDDKVLPMPPALGDGDTSHFRHEGRSWRIDRVVLASESRTVVTLIDIEQEERAAEARATAEMIQVLGHELLNGLAPIVSLADSGLAAIDKPMPDTPLLREILGTLTRQADGLQRFVEAYRVLARLPAPQIRLIRVAQLIEDLTRLFASRWWTAIRSARPWVRWSRMQRKQQPPTGGQARELKLLFAISIRGWRSRSATTAMGFLPNSKPWYFALSTRRNLTVRVSASVSPARSPRPMVERSQSIDPLIRFLVYCCPSC